MNNLEIFDKDGKPLHIQDFLTQFLKSEAKRLGIRYDGIRIGIDYGYSSTTEQLYILDINGGRIDSLKTNEL